MDGQGKRRCGGEGCDGLVSLAHNSWQKAQDFDKEITSAMEEVEKLSKMVRGEHMLTGVADGRSLSPRRHLRAWHRHYTPH